MKGHKSMFLAIVFALSCVAGYTLDLSAEPAMASPPIFVNPIDLISHKNVQKSTEVIDVEINVETNEITVKGNVDATVNVRAIGEVKPKVVRKTVYKTDTINTGYPLLRSMIKVEEKPVSPLSLCCK